MLFLQCVVFDGRERDKVLRAGAVQVKRGNRQRALTHVGDGVLPLAYLHELALLRDGNSWHGRFWSSRLEWSGAVIVLSNCHAATHQLSNVIVRTDAKEYREHVAD